MLDNFETKYIIGYLSAKLKKNVKKINKFLYKVLYKWCIFYDIYKGFCEMWSKTSTNNPYTLCKLNNGEIQIFLWLTNHSEYFEINWFMLLESLSKSEA